MTRALEKARETIAGCAAGGTLIAAGGSTLYPHVWARDVGIASLGILCDPGARGAGEEALVRSLEMLARHQSARGRMPLKVDPRADVAVWENSAGIDAGLWFAIAVAALARARGSAPPALVDAAERAVEWVAHLDVDGTELICSPEAGDWADMMPHRHHVLFVNVSYVLALRSLASLRNDAAAADFARRAVRVAERIDQLFWLGDVTSGEASAERLRALAMVSPEWGIGGQYATRYGSMPYYLSYSAHRQVGRHFDTVGNFLAILAGICDPERAAGILRFAHQVGVHLPAPSKTLYPPIYPGDPDWRDWFHWRNLCVPHQYQNGGCWPFVGALHVTALVRAGQIEEAREVYSGLEAVCTGGDVPFPEWVHGQTGAAMGEAHQLWSATGLLWAERALRDGAPPILSALPG